MAETHSRRGGKAASTPAWRSPRLWAPASKRLRCQIFVSSISMHLHTPGGQCCGLDAISARC
ncbi:hypothetical protein Taro_006989, partial [Colocasia esculenta]|nr:hypothetical protein [Colocasia esculenta]